MQISETTRALAAEAEAALSEIFRDIDETARAGTERVLDVFREERVSEGMFAPSTGYGYGDSGRDAIDRIAAKVFGAEAGFMRPAVISGTHALTIGLFALLRWWMRARKQTVQIGGQKARVIGPIGAIETLVDVTEMKCGPGDAAVFELDPLYARGLPREYR